MRAKGRLMTMQAMTGKTEGRHSTLDEVLAMETGAQATVHGLVHTLRDLGDVRFALLRMPQGVLQCVLGAGEDVRDGDAVTVSGEAVRDERAPGGVELHAQRVKVLSRAAEAMPVPIGKNKMNLSLDTDLSLRFVTLRNLRKRAVFKIQEGIVRGFREALQKEGFTEIHSPKIVAQNAEGGANLFRMEYFGRRAYLAQSPQFYKQAMVPVYERVFEIGPVFRAEKHNTQRHLNEYTSMDFEMGFIDGFEDVMQMETKVLQNIMAVLKADYAPQLAALHVALPVANKKVVEFAVAAGLATNCEITRYNKFDRKNYFYPDLPKAYQVSQLYLPICRNGHVDIETAAGKKAVGIHEIHMEEDAGKLVHDPWLDETMVDYNRCGVPLLEIVSEPDMRSAEEVIAYLTKLRQTLQYLGVSDCRMQEGSLRADVNLSVRPVGQKEFGTRTEMKNINSFKAIARAIAGEYRRQVELIEDGGQVKQQTRRWDDNKDASFAMRSKENAQDYRYFPEPDLPPMEISQAFIDAVRARQPELAEAKIARYQREFGLPEYDARILTEEKPMAELFERAAAVCGRAKEASNWIMGETMAMMKEKAVLPENLTLSGDALGAIIRAAADGRISRQSAREVFAYAFDGGEDVEGYIKRHGLEMVSDDAAYERVLSEVLAACEKDVAAYRAGNEKVFGFLVGQAMKALRGKADPKKISEMLGKMLKA